MIFGHDSNWNKIIFWNENLIPGKKKIQGPNLVCANLQIFRVLMEIQSRWIGLRIMYIRVGKYQTKNKNGLACF